jgi:aromatic-L-amino-acid decarboxylase
VDSTLEPDRRVIADWSRLALDFLTAWHGDKRAHPAQHHGVAPDRAALYAAPGEDSTDMALLLKVFDSVAAAGVDTRQSEYMAYVPSGGLYASVIGDVVARAVNQYTGVPALAPDLVALEQGVLAWLCEQIGWSAPAGGLITTGASMSTLAAIVAARHHRLGSDLSCGTVYISEHTHHSVAKAAQIAGLPPTSIRVVPTTADLRMDVTVAEEMITRDRAEGKTPFLLVATAGTTDTGTIDPLANLGQLSARKGLWFHVDAAYGGGFTLTDRGRARLIGITTADSVALDAHKSLFTCLGTGVLLARDLALLRSAHTATGPYWHGLPVVDDLPDFASLGPELTREARGPRLWFALHAHGVRAFRATLDEKLDLAAMAHARLAADPILDAPWVPDLSTVVARVRGPGDGRTNRLIRQVNSDHGVILSATRIRGQVYIRMCILLPGTHRTDVERVVGYIQSAARRT